MDDAERDAAFLAVWMDIDPRMPAEIRSHAVALKVLAKAIWDTAWFERQGEIDLLTSQVATVRSIYQGWLSEAKATIRQLETVQSIVTADTVA